MALVLLASYLMSREIILGHTVDSAVGGLLAGSGVLWAWILMILNGAWRPHASWIDRLGRLAGVGWLVVGAVSLFDLMGLV